MGYSTTITISNDALHAIEKNPEQFVEGIAQHIGYGRSGIVPVGGYGNYVKVMRTEHADVFRLFSVHQGATYDLSEWCPETMKLALSDKQYLRDIIDNNIKQAELNLKNLKKSIAMERKAIDDSV